VYPIEEEQGPGVDDNIETDTDAAVAMQLARGSVTSSSRQAFPWPCSRQAFLLSSLSKHPGGQASDSTIIIDDTDQNDDTNNKVDTTNEVNDDDEDHSGVAITDGHVRVDVAHTGAADTS
jgi:hypothetical protein